MTLNGISIFVHNELCKVPFDGVKKRSTLLILQESPQRMSFLSVDINFLEEIEFDLVILQETLNLLSVTWFLIVELIAGEWKDA